MSWRLRIGGVPHDIDRVMVEEACHRSMHLGGMPVRVAKHYLRPGWKTAMPLYVIWCEHCARGTVTHPQGKGRISCSLCGHARPVWTPWKTRNYVVQPLMMVLPIVILVVVIWLIAVTHR